MATARPKGRGYEIRAYCGLGIRGNRLDKSRTWVPDPGMTKKQIEKELERQKVLFEEEIKGGVCLDEGTRFFDFAKQWMEEHGKGNLAPMTYRRYTDHLKRINQAIGHKKLKDITPPMLNSFYRNLTEDGICKKKWKDENGNWCTGGKLSPRTILDIHRVVSSILNTAVKWGLIPSSPASKATPPRVPRNEISCLDEHEVQRMIELLSGEPVQYRTIAFLALLTGMRRGEICGLEWKDIDFDNQQMRVVRSSQYIGNKTIITKEPKTQSGVRQFALSDTACTILRQHKVWQNEVRLSLGDQWNSTDRLFTTWNGLPIFPDTLTGWFRDFTRKHDFPPVTFHSLRHTHATLLIAEGTDIATVSKRMGHASVSTTLGTYTHALKSKDAEAARALDAMLNLNTKNYA